MTFSMTFSTVPPSITFDTQKQHSNCSVHRYRPVTYRARKSRRLIFEGEDGGGDKARHSKFRRVVKGDPEVLKDGVDQCISPYDLQLL